MSKALEERIFNFILKNDVVSDEDMARAVPSEPQDRVDVINSLLSANRIQLVGIVGSHCYKALAQEEVTKVKGLSVEDMLVYQVISQAGNMGIWTRDMKQRTNLAQVKITKTLKLLEERNLVKSVKSVQNASRKVYMLANLEPAKEITGGPWYGSDQQPDKEFIDTIRDVVADYVAKHGVVAVDEVANEIASSGISNQVLQVEDVHNIIKTLVYDSVLESRSPMHGQEMYGLSTHPVPESTPFTDIPCGVCPVFNSCHEGGPISPEKCEYYSRWLGVDF